MPISSVDFLRLKPSNNCYEKLVGKSGYLGDGECMHLGRSLVQSSKINSQIKIRLTSGGLRNSNRTNQRSLTIAIRRHGQMRTWTTHLLEALSVLKR